MVARSSNSIRGQQRRETAHREPSSGTATAVFTDFLTQPQLSDTTVTYSTQDGTAIAGADYTAVSGTLLVAKGQTSATDAVPILPDTVVKANRTFTLNLISSSVGSLGKASATAIIVDTAGPPALSVGDATVLEGPVGGGNPATFTVYLSYPSTQTITVNYSTADGTAHAGVDYVTASGTLTFNPGQTTQTFTVSTIRDQLQDGNLTFSVNLSAPTNAIIARPQGTGTIVDTNGLGISVGDATVVRSQTNTVFAQLTAYMSNQPPSDQTEILEYTTADGTASNRARAGIDYTGTYDTTFGVDGTRQLTGIVVNFDRPVDPSTITANQVNVEYRSPTMPAPSPPINISSPVTGVQALNEDGPVLMSVGDAIVREPE
jgi:hypothetical protein